MKLIGGSILDEFRKKHADVRISISAWVAEVEEAEWKTSLDIKARYVHASIIGEKLVVFNMKGNRYRILTKIDYSHQVVLVKRIGTHEEYASWDL